MRACAWQTILDFKNGLRNLLIATSVAGRGLDVKNLVLVVNYNCPNHLEDYIHRVGRTGRAGRKGTAITFITPEEGQYAPDLVRALTDSKQVCARTHCVCSLLPGGVMLTQLLVCLWRAGGSSAPASTGG